MTEHRLGRGFDALRLEEQVRALRDHAVGQELVIAVLFKAVERLGVEFIWPGDGGPEDPEAMSEPSRLLPDELRPGD